MSREPESVSKQSFGALQGCLVEGDPEQRRRESSVRRSALVISVVLQSTILLALVLIPLFARPARIWGDIVSPPAPYYRQGGPRRSPPQQPRPSRVPQNICRFCAPRAIPRTVQMVDVQPTDERVGPSFPGQIPMIGAPTRVSPPVEAHAEKSRLHVTRLDPAMLIHRVEPVYPTLARQLGRAGRVELRAVIATDGTIQSLQVVGGDPLFYQSALEAVRQWRYRPTVLNGDAVEIDTFITVIYSMQR
jgi:periplasmic protein TonB